MYFARIFPYYVEIWLSYAPAPINESPMFKEHNIYFKKKKLRKYTLFQCRRMFNKSIPYQCLLLHCNVDKVSHRDSNHFHHLYDECTQKVSLLLLVPGTI